MAGDINSLNLLVDIALFIGLIPVYYHTFDNRKDLVTGRILSYTRRRTLLILFEDYL